MNTSFTSKQREVLARKLGYEGPMQGFDEFLQSSPALMMRYNAVTDKYAKRMAKGGVVGYAEGGLTMSTEIPPGEDSPRPVWRDSAGRVYGEAQVFQGSDGQWQVRPQFAPPPSPTPASTPTPSATQTPTTTAQPMSVEDARAFVEEMRAFGQQNDAKVQALPEVQALSSFTQTFAGRQPTPQELAKAQELNDAVQNSPAFKAIVQEQQEFGNTNKQRIDAYQQFTSNPDNENKLRQMYGFAPVQQQALDRTGATPPTISPEAQDMRAQTGPTPQELTEGRAKEQQQTTAGGVTGGGRTTFSEAQGRAGVPIPGQAAGITPAMTPITPEQSIAGVGGAGEAAGAAASQVGTAAQATQPTQITAATAQPTTAAEGVTQAVEALKPAQGTVSEQAQVEAQKGYVSPESLAQAATVGEQFIQPVTAEKRVTEAGELATAATAEQAPTVQAAQTTAPTAIEAAQGTVKAEELVTPAQIKEEDMAQAQAITADGLAPDAVAVAARLDKFTVDAGTLAQAAQGNVDALSTVQGQLTSLMKSFDDGATPAWAAGAIRAANAAMSARGLGGSSIAGAAIFQAAMESALPIAQQDAQVFQQINLANLNNRQQVALANAAAQQGLSLQNLNNEQQAALQNSANAFSLQSQNLSNMQQTMLANTQIRAALQGQNLTNQQQAAVVNAARYAEMNNINLNNIQQAKLQDSTNALQTDLANLSNRQQSYVANAQLQAALQNKNLDNLQQTAVVNAARIAENNNISFNAQQQAQLHNSELLKTIGVAELNAQQATTLANAATLAGMDMANLNNRQQAAVVNAQSFLQMDMSNLDKEQQATLFRGQQITQALLSDAAAENAMKQFNATSQNQVDQFMVSLATQVSQFNASQKNAIDQFNTDQANAVSRFNAEQTNAREQFNATQRLVIDQSNAQWRRDVSTADTAAVNAANYLNAQNLQQMTLAEYNNETQLYRDQIQMMWNSFEKDADRVTQLAVSEIQARSETTAASTTAKASMWTAVGGLLANIKW